MPNQTWDETTENEWTEDRPENEGNVMAPGVSLNAYHHKPTYDHAPFCLANRCGVTRINSHPAPVFVRDQ